MSIDNLHDSSADDALIVAASRRDAASLLDARIPTDGFASWDAARSFIQRLYAHRIPGLVLSAFDRCGVLDRVVPETRTALSTHLLHQRRRSGILLLELERLGGEFGQAGIECTVLKGAGLGLTVYDTPEQRFMSDLDLLVRPERFNDALALLLDCGYENRWPEEAIRGYRAYHYHLPLSHPAGYVLELHWDLVKPGRLYGLDPSSLIDASAPVPGLHPVLRVPGPEHQVLHTVVQQLQDGFAYLVRTVDLDRLFAAGTIDWDTLVAQAEENRLGPALAFATLLARHLFDSEYPPQALQRLRPGRLARTHLSLFDPVKRAVDQRLMGRRTANRLLRFWLTEKHLGRAALMAEVVREREDHEPFREPWAWKDRLTHASHPNRAVGLAKLAALQLWTYLQAIADLPTRRGRSQMRFWSSQLSSSERL